MFIIPVIMDLIFVMEIWPKPFCIVIIHEHMFLYHTHVAFFVVLDLTESSKYLNQFIRNYRVFP